MQKVQPTVVDLPQAPIRPYKKSLSRGKGIHRKLTKKPVQRRIKPRGISKLKKELDKWFSLYIRIRDDGRCYTCPKKDEIKKMQAGHFVPRQYLAVRWDERNVHCQCYACNVLYNGQPSKYATRLIDDYGLPLVKLLESKRKEVVKLDEAFYLEKIAYYKQAVDNLQKEVDWVLQ